MLLGLMEFLTHCTVSHSPFKKVVLVSGCEATHCSRARALHTLLDCWACAGVRERQKQGKANTHVQSRIVNYRNDRVLYMLMRDEKEGRKKPARSNKQSKATQHMYTYCECWWVDDGVDHHNLLEQSRHGPERVPQHRCQVGQDLPFPTQLNESMLTRTGAGELLYPLKHLFVCVVCTHCLYALGIEESRRNL